MFPQFAVNLSLFWVYTINVIAIICLSSTSAIVPSGKHSLTSNTPWDMTFNYSVTVSWMMSICRCLVLWSLPPFLASLSAFFQPEGNITDHIKFCRGDVIFCCCYEDCSFHILTVWYDSAIESIYHKIRWKHVSQLISMILILFFRMHSCVT